MSEHCTINDVYIRWGEVTVKKWADLDNTPDHLQEIDERIRRSIQYASADVEMRLYPGVLVVPNPVHFVDIVRRITSELTGYYLYSARGVMDAEGDSDNKMIGFKKYCLAELDALRGLIVSASGSRGPAVVKDAQDGPCSKGCLCPETNTSRFS